MEQYQNNLRTMYRYSEMYDLQQELYDYYEDREFWKQQTSQGEGPVLELGCGTGRIGCYLIEKGTQIMIYYMKI